MWARLAWQPPEKPNGVVLYYQVVVEETSFGSTTAALQFNVTGSRTEFMVTPLTPYTCYSYFVTAATAVGAGAQTNKEFFCTEQYSTSVHLLSDPFLYIRVCVCVCVHVCVRVRVCVCVCVCVQS